MGPLAYFEGYCLKIGGRHILIGSDDLINLSFFSGHNYQTTEVVLLFSYAFNGSLKIILYLCQRCRADDPQIMSLIALFQYMEEILILRYPDSFIIGDAVHILSFRILTN